MKRTRLSALKSSKKYGKTKDMLIGNRIPKDFFITKGRGESDITVHAGSYHLALKNADIEMCNIMTYSSILPGIAREIKRPEVLTHGSVMETIMATATCRKGEYCSAGIIFGWLYDRKSNKKYGGLVCEYNGPLPRRRAEAQLRESLNELYTNGYSERFLMKNITVISDEIKPKKKFGTALVALCFTNYVFPRG